MAVVRNFSLVAALAALTLGVSQMFASAPASQAYEGVPVDQRPSFLVIRADELRASALGCYGDPNAQTPVLDALAKSGVRYDRALSSSPVCSAHRTSFDLGFFTTATRNGDKLHPSDITIHDVLDDEGYHTFHVGKWHKTPDSMSNMLTPQMAPAAILDGLDYHAGHEQFHKLKGPQSVYYVNGVANAIPAGPWRPQTHVDLALTQIDAAVAADVPFYGVVDLEPPHYPYGPIVGTQWDIFQAGDIPAPPNVPAAAVAQSEIDLAKYYSMVFSIDDMVGQLLAHLKQLGIDDSTVVLFTADHGAHLGAHGLVENAEQKRTPYQEAISVPLLIYDPLGVHGVVNRRFFSTVDFKRLILLRAQAPVDPASHALTHLFEGRLLIQPDAGNTQDGAWYGFLRSDGMKYARSENSGPWLLFDTAADPYEMTNLIGTGDPREAEMQALLDQAAAAIGLTIPF